MDGPFKVTMNLLGKDVFFCQKQGMRGYTGLMHVDDVNTNDQTISGFIYRTKMYQTAILHKNDPRISDPSTNGAYRHTGCFFTFEEAEAAAKAKAEEQAEKEKLAAAESKKVKSGGKQSAPTAEQPVAGENK